jgi:hypothetical protein
MGTSWSTDDVLYETDREIDFGAVINDDYSRYSSLIASVLNVSAAAIVTNWGRQMIVDAGVEFVSYKPQTPERQAIVEVVIEGLGRRMKDDFW